MLVYTICSKSYLAFAEVLAESLQRSNGSRLSVVLLDGDDGIRLADADVVLPSQLPFESIDEFHRMATIYDVVELATAIKPWAFRHFLAQGHDAVVYLDPDIEVFDDLSEVGCLAREHGIVLNPHSTNPLPRDGKFPDETSLLLAGTFNLGFLGVGPGSGAFLDWWAERLRRDCVNNVDEGYFVDQRWIDLVPSYFRYVLLKDPGYNVAYWNLPVRSFTRAADRYLVEGKPLRFFHFSGFSPKVPHLLSRHQGNPPRVLLSENAALRQVCSEYATALRRHGFEQRSTIAYGFDRAANGFTIDRRVRRAYRDALLREESTGSHPSLPDPFTVEGADALAEWLREPESPRVPELSRYLRAVWNERQDLRTAFPKLDGSDGRRFVDWAIDGVVEPPIPSEFRPRWELRTAQALQPAPSTAAPSYTEGVNLYGYVFAESGTGQIGRSIVSALKAARIPYAVVPFTETVNRQEHRFTEHGNEEPVYDTNLICVNADQVPVFLDKVGRQILEGRYNIGVWAWEVDDLPQWMAKSGELLDEVWGISEYTSSALRGRLRIPVRAFPLPVEPAEPVERTRQELGLPEGFLFLFAFDFESVMERKNPLAVIAAFRRAFPQPGEASLCIKTVNGGRHRDELEMLRVGLEDRPDIHIVDGYRTAEDHRAIMNACDVYVSLHRAEGFGLTVAEAMSLGKPAIVTNYSSTTEFATSENSYLVPFTMVSVPSGTRAYPSTAHWADPDITVAASLMKRVHEKRDEARNVGERARRDIESLHGPAARAQRLCALLEETWRRRRSPQPAHERTAETLADVMQVNLAEQDVEALLTGPDPFLPSRYSWLARPLRRLMLRVIRNYWVHQNRIDRALLASIRKARTAAASELRATREELTRRQRQVEESTVATTRALQAENAVLRRQLALLLEDARENGDKERA